MFNKTYNWMVPRVDKSAAHAGMHVLYARVLFLLAVAFSVVSGFLFSATLVIGIFVGSTLLASLIYFYAVKKFLHALSKYFNRDLSSYNAPYVGSSRLFTLWLEDLGKNSN